MIKQIIVVRKDLKMKLGKIISQSCHASMKIFFDRMKELQDKNGVYFRTTNITPEMVEWKNGIYTKIVLSCDSERELLSLYKSAGDHNISRALIKDNGRTVFKNVPTYTCIALGPDKSEKIDKVTGHLALL